MQQAQDQDQDQHVFQVSSHGKKVFGLLDLPDELWARIGREVVDLELSEKQERISKELADARRGDLPFCLWTEVDQTILLFRPSIIQTCRKLRHELVPYYCHTFQPIVLCSASCAPTAHAQIVHCVYKWLVGADLSSLNGLRLFRQLSESDAAAMNILGLCHVRYQSRWKELNDQNKFGHLEDKFMLGCYQADLGRAYEVVLDQWSEENQPERTQITLRPRFDRYRRRYL